MVGTSTAVWWAHGALSQPVGRDRLVSAQVAPFHAQQTERGVAPALPLAALVVRLFLSPLPFASSSASLYFFQLEGTISAGRQHAENVYVLRPR